MFRLQIGGVALLEVLLSYLFCQIVVIILVSSFMVESTFFLYGLSSKGSAVTLILLNTHIGIFGVCLGLFVSTIVKDASGALQAASGIFVALVYTGGNFKP